MTSRTRLPYPGLRAYEREETDLFFGREACVNEMVDRLAAGRFLAVLGASGSGKSSLVRTGLLDALELGFHAAAGPYWMVADFHPGGNPLRNLAEALLFARDGARPEAADVDVLQTFLQRGPRSIVEWVADGNLPDGQNLLILVDQFEELFRYEDYAGREKSEAFAALLSESARADSRLHVVITMRSEYLGVCALIPGLVERINASLYLTPRMTREECRQAIEGPAAVVGFDIEPQLVSRLLNDLSSFAPWEGDEGRSQLQRLARQADQLPLMQHALSRLWQLAERRGSSDRPVLTLRDYLDMGQLQGALDQHAASVVDGLSEAARGLVGRVFRALVAGANLTDAVRRPMRFDRLRATVGGDREAVAEVVDAFRARDCNFLRPPEDRPIGDDTVIDISHESLIRQWDRLAGWFEEEARSSALWSRLIFAEERRSAGEGELFGGLDLANASAWWRREAPTKSWADNYGGRFDEVERFLRESEEKEERSDRLERERHDKERRRLRARASAYAVLALVAGLTAALFVGLNRQKESLNTKLAKANTSLVAFKEESSKALVSFSEVIERIRSANVIGFSLYQRDLFEALIPLQNLTIESADKYLSKNQIVSLRRTYSGALETTGDSRKSIAELEAAYELSKAHLSTTRDPTKLEEDFVTRFFEIVVLHSWNLMNAGNHAAAAQVLEFSSGLERAFAGATDPRFLDGISRVENARARYQDDLGQVEAAYDSQRRALLLQQRAVELAPENSRYLRGKVVYLRNMSIQNGKLARHLKATNPKRAEELDKESLESDAIACETVVKAIAKNKIDTRYYRSYAACRADESSGLSKAGKVSEADAPLSETLTWVDLVLQSDPRNLDLKMARLKLLEARFGLEDLRSAGISEERKRRADALLEQWLAIVGQRTTLPTDIHGLGTAYASISLYLQKEEVPSREKEAAYRRISEALRPSLEAFPGAKKYQEIASDVAYRMGEILFKRGDADDEALTYYDEAILRFSRTGVLDSIEKPNERFDDACGAHVGKLKILARKKDVDRTLEVHRTLFDRCAPILARHGWDFYLRSGLLASNLRLGELLFERGRYGEARAPLEYGSHWAVAEASRYLSQMYRSGLGVPRDIEKADSLLALAKRQSGRRFTVPADFSGVSHPFFVYVYDWPRDFEYTGIDDQAKWLAEHRGGKIADDVTESFRKLHEIARANDVSFPELATYAIDAKQTEERGGPSREIVDAKATIGFVANPAISVDVDGIAISGFDPVAYIEDRKPVRGVETHFAVWNGAVWLFANAEHRQRFVEAPDRYAPAYGGFCAECLAQGHKVHADPLAWSVHGGKSHLFQSAPLAKVWAADLVGRSAAADAAWKEASGRGIAPAARHRAAEEERRRSEGAAKLEAGRTATTAGNHDEALTLLKQAEASFGADLKVSLFGRTESLASKAALASAYGRLSHLAVLAGKDTTALEAADLGLALDRDEAWIRTNRAHALMFSGREAEARSVYMLARGAQVPDFATFEDAVRADFVELRKAGRTHPLMAEIEAIFATERGATSGAP